MKKRILSLVLTIVMLLSVAPFGTFNLTASAEPFTDGDFKYWVYDNKATISAYIGSATNLTIPSTLGGYQVTEIGYEAFQNCTSIESVEIPYGVTEIQGDEMEEGAFSGCTTLKNMHIPNSVTRIGHKTFYECTALESITIPDSVIEIGNHAFYRCTSLENITISNNVTKMGNNPFLETAYYNNSANWQNGVLYIGNYLIGAEEDIVSCSIKEGTKTIATGAFYYSPELTNVIIPNSVTKIDDNTFYECTALQSVTIGNSVTEIGDYAFSECTALESVYITDLKAWCEIDFEGYYSNPLYYANNLYLDGRLVTDLVIPEGVTEIKNYAFSGCTSITSITIPDSVTEMGSSAFNYCTSLEKLNIYISNIKNWCEDGLYQNNYNGNYDLRDCAKDFYLNGELITNLIIPEGTTSIGEDAFYNWSSLTSVDIPRSVSKIGDDAFYNCTSLKKVNITDIKSWCEINFYPYGFNSNPLAYAKKLYINNQLVTNLVVPEGTKKINSNSFYNCSSIESLQIPNSVTEIGSSAFYNCFWLENIIIPKSVTTINSDAFGSCSNIKNVYFEGSKDDWRNIDFTNGNDYLVSANIIYNAANACVHEYLYETTLQPTCSSYGRILKKCSRCGLVEESNLPLAPTGKHNYKCIKTVNATYTAAGYKQYKCTGCTASYTTTIAKLPKTSIAKAKVTGIKDMAYTGKKATQSITVKLGNVTLKKGTDYIVTCNDKNIGKATVTITGIGKYEDNIKKTFTIKPKTASLKSFKSPKKKQAKVTWKKDSKVTGYQIVYATNSKFTNGKKTVTVKSYKTTSKTIKSLKSKKTYYVKIRSYKTVNGKKIYGAYSKVKKVKIK